MIKTKIDGVTVQAALLIDDVFVDPVLSANFDSTPNTDRPAKDEIWWDRPFIITDHSNEPKWLETFPSGCRYMVRCLDGGAWDRSTMWGAFGKLTEAIACAKAGPSWRRKEEGK